jgi:DNA-binding NarL/FixJ family response regulator
MPESASPRRDVLRILIADDHPVVRRHVRNILRRENDWEVCAEATTGSEAVAMNAILHPDLVVLDLSMPELNGLEAAKLIHEQYPETEMIILTMHESFEVMDQMTAFGVRTCIMKTDLQQLVVAIRDIWEAKFSAANVFRSRALPL